MFEEKEPPGKRPASPTISPRPHKRFFVPDYSKLEFHEPSSNHGAWTNFLVDSTKKYVKCTMPDCGKIIVSNMSTMRKHSDRLHGMRFPRVKGKDSV